MEIWAKYCFNLLYPDLHGNPCCLESQNDRARTIEGSKRPVSYQRKSLREAAVAVGKIMKFSPKHLQASAT